MLMGLIFKRFNLPIIISYILTGVIIGSFLKFKGMASDGELNDIASFGIVFMMFMIGLEFSFNRLNSMKKEVLLYGLAQMLLCVVGFFIFLHYFVGFNFSLSLVISMALSLSSTAIVLKILQDDNMLNKTHGKAILGILILQDIVVIPILLIIAILNDSSASLSVLVLKSVISISIVLVVMLLPGKYFANKILGYSAKSKVDEIFLGTVLFIVLGSAYISEEFGFSHSLGAFLAGMIVSKSKFKYQIEADLAPLKDMLMALFFITVGMQVDVIYALSKSLYILIVIAIIMSLKALLIFLALRLFAGKKTAIKSALGLCQIGEFAFVVFINSENIILNSKDMGGLLGFLLQSHAMEFHSADLHQFLILLVISSMIFTPFIFKYLNTLTSKINTEDNTEALVVPQTGTYDVIVCGYGNLGKEIVKELKNANINYVAIDGRLSEVVKGEENNDNVIYGRLAKKTILDQVNIDKAQFAIIAFEAKEYIKDLCEYILSIAPTINLIVRVEDKTTKEELEILDDVKIIDQNEELAKIAILKILKD